jgi:hypothetical protein
MRNFLLVFVFFIVSCSPPEPGTDAWFKEKHKELLKANPEVVLSLEEFKDILTSQTLALSDDELMEKHSIRFWLMEDNFLPSSEDSKSMAPVYIRTLKQCAANFSIMHGNMEAGLMYGEAITGLDDVNEMFKLSDEYIDHAYYFATRASEIHYKLTNESAEIAISDEIESIQTEINTIDSDTKFLELLDSNAEICIMVRNQNPNNKNYIFDLN